MKRKRAAVKKNHSKGVLVFFPETALPVIQKAVEILDTDRSKFIRSAVKEKLARDCNLHVKAAR